MKICCFCYGVSKHVNTQIYFCDQTKAIATCSTRLAAGNLAGAAKKLAHFRPQILWFVAVFSSLVFFFL